MSGSSSSSFIPVARMERERNRNAPQTVRPRFATTIKPMPHRTAGTCLFPSATTAICVSRCLIHGTFPRGALMSGFLHGFLFKELLKWRATFELETVLSVVSFKSSFAIQRASARPFLRFWKNNLIINCISWQAINFCSFCCSQKLDSVTKTNRRAIFPIVLLSYQG